MRKQLNSKHLMMQSLHDRATIDTVGAANEFAPSEPLSEPRKDDPRKYKKIGVICTTHEDSMAKTESPRAKMRGKLGDSRIGTIS